MGIKKNLVIFQGRPSCSTLELIESIGFRNIVPCENSLLDDYICPNNDVVAVAYWGDFTVVAHDSLPMSMIHQEFSRRMFFEEITKRRYFKSKNSLAVLLHSATNTYGMGA